MELAGKNTHEFVIGDLACLSNIYAYGAALIVVSDLCFRRVHIWPGEFDKGYEPDYSGVTAGWECFSSKRCGVYFLSSDVLERL